MPRLSDLWAFVVEVVAPGVALLAGITALVVGVLWVLGTVVGTLDRMAYNTKARTPCYAAVIVVHDGARLTCPHPKHMPGRAALFQGLPVWVCDCEMVPGGAGAAAGAAGAAAEEVQDD